MDKDMRPFYVQGPCGDLIVVGKDEKQVAEIVTASGFYYAVNIIPVESAALMQSGPKIFHLDRVKEGVKDATS